MAAQADDGPVHEPAEQVAQKQAWLAEHGGSGDDGGIAAACSGDGANLFYPFSATDGTWTLALDGNDDGSTSLISLPFAVSFFGESFPGLFINNNGNVTFGASTGAFSSTGFPANGPKMIAAFWADVDTRPAASGKVWRKSLDSNGDGTLDTFVVTWENVGYYSNQVDKLNTFQIILTDGTNQFVGLGQRAAFSYDNMCWTTGSASSGSNGFGGTPATVGVNRGNGIDFFQIGRFNQNNANYDGPGGANDGIDYLDGKFFTFSLGSGGSAPNVPPVCTNLPSGNAVALTVGQAFDTTLNFIPPEATQTTEVQVLNGSLLQPLGFTFTPSTPGSLTTLRVQWTPSGSGVGVRSLQLRATDNAAAPAFSDFTVSFSVSPLPPTNVQASDGTLAGIVRITWNPSAGATSYDILRRLGSGAFGTIATVGDVSQYEDTTAISGQQYSYSVVARGGGLASQQSAPDNGLAGLAAPIAAASAGTFTDRVRVSWSAVPGADSYRVFLNDQGQSVLVATVTATLFDDLSALIGLERQYTVAAAAGSFLGPSSGAVVGWRAPAAPQGLQATDGSQASGVAITWSAVDGATGYRVLRGTSAGSLSPVASVSQLTWFDGSAQPGVVYTYAVRAITPAGDGPQSAADTGFAALVTGGVTGVNASDGTQTSGVRIVWQPLAAATGYRIFRSGGDEPLQVGAVGASTTIFTDNSIQPGTLATYFVRATVVGGALGPPSQVDTGWRGMLAPLGVAASDGASLDGIEVSWSAAQGAIEYRVFRSLGNAAPTPIGTTEGQLQFRDTSALSGLTYSYVVRAVGQVEGALSPVSIPNEGWRALAAPTGVAASDGTTAGGVLVSWLPSSGAVTYRISRALETQGAVGPPTQIAVGVTGLQFNDSTAAVGALYRYRVQAVAANPLRVSELSVFDAGYRLLPSPASVNATDGTSTVQVGVSWAGVPGATGYQVLRRIGSAPFELLGSVNGALQWADVNANPGQPYDYAIRSVAATGVSQPSPVNTGYRQLAAPTGIAATDGTRSDGVMVQWGGSNGAQSFEVWRSLGSAAPVRLATLSASVPREYIDAGAIPGVVYSFTVKAVGLIGVSASSAADSGFRQAVPPNSVLASDGTSTQHVAVSWSAVPSALGYKVLRSTGGSIPEVRVTVGATVVTWNDSQAASGVVYEYSLRTVMPSGESIASGADTGYRGLTAPVGVQASDGSSSAHVAVTWLSVSGATSYQVLRSVGGGTPVILGSTPTGQLSFTDSTAMHGQVFNYFVAALNTAGPSALSASNSGYRQVVPPLDVQATDGTLPSGVRISWSASAGATGYRVFRATMNGSVAGTVTQIGVTSNALEFVDSSAAFGVVYRYSLRTVGAPNGSVSVESTGDLGSRGLSAPINFVATDGQFTDRVALSWTASAGAESYQVFRGDSASPLVESIVGTSFNDTSAPAGTRFNYSVRAVGPTGSSAPSASDDGFRQLLSPTGVQASDGLSSDSVSVSWNPVAGAEAYELFRSGASTPITVTAATNFVDSPVNGIPAVGLAYSYTVRARGAVGISAPSVADSGYRAMPAPTGVVASDGTSALTVTVSWNAVPAAVVYRVWRATGSAPLAVIATVANPGPYVDSTASLGVVHRYAVSAVSAAGNGLTSPSDDGCRRLASPSGIAASDGSSTAHVVINWQAVVGAVGYQVFRDGSETPIAEVTSGFSVLDTQALPGVQHAYAVRAQGAATAMLSAMSSADVGFRQMRAPESVSASDGDLLAGVQVSWSSVVGATAYQVLRSPITNGVLGPAVQRGVVLDGQPGGLVFLDALAVPGVRYAYGVAAVGTAPGAASLPSAFDFGHRNRAGATNVQASENIPAHVRVTWTLAAAGTPAVSGYEVRRVVGEETPVVLTSALAATVTQYDDTTAVPGTQYTYEVRARYTLAGSSPAVVVTTLPGSDAGMRPVPAGSGDGGVAGGGDEGGGADDSALTEAGEGEEGSLGGASTAAGSGSTEPGAQQPNGDGSWSDADDEGDGDDTSVCGAVMRGLASRIAAAGVAASTAGSTEARVHAKERLESLEALREMIAFTRVDASGQTVQWTERAACAMQRGDINLDGEVDGRDFALFMDAWRAGDEVLADLDRSGVVDAHDLAQMLAAVGGE